MANRVSLCLIVHNGEPTLPDCLRSVADLVQEMIVVPAQCNLFPSLQLHGALTAPRSPGERVVCAPAQCNPFPSPPTPLPRGRGGLRAARPVSVAFASFFPRPFHAGSPYEQPLGGSESALCYLAEALAARGERVLLLNAGGATGVSRGVTCRPLTPAALRRLPELDGFVVQNLAGQGRLLRQALSPRTRLLVAAVVDARKGLDGHEEALRRQVAQVLRESTWDRWAERWAASLARL